VVKQQSPKVHYCDEATSSDSKNGRRESVKKATKGARARHKNTNYGKGIFGHKMLDFETMTKESFAKSQFKKGDESSRTETEQDEEDE